MYRSIMRNIIVDWLPLLAFLHFFPLYPQSWPIIAATCFYYVLTMLSIWIFMHAYRSKPFFEKLFPKIRLYPLWYIGLNALCDLFVGFYIGIILNLWVLGALYIVACGCTGLFNLIKRYAVDTGYMPPTAVDKPAE